MGDIVNLYDEIVNPDFEELPEFVNLSGVTMQNRQSFILNLSLSESIELKRVYQNQYDKNAIGVFLKDGRQLGWIQKHHASILAPEIDCGVKWRAKLESIVGNGPLLGVLIRLYIEKKYDII